MLKLNAEFTTTDGMVNALDEYFHSVHIKSKLKTYNNLQAILQVFVMSHVSIDYVVLSL